jgi:hypothetical protein
MGAILAILLAAPLDVASVGISVTVLENVDELPDGTLVPSLPPDPDLPVLVAVR